MNIVAALIDCDGTIVDSETHHWRAWQAILEPWNIEISFQQFADNWVGKPESALAEHILTNYTLNISHAELVQSKSEYFAQLCLTEPMPLLFGIVDTLEVFKQQGIKMAVVSGGKRANVFDAIEGNHLQGYFDAIITGDDVSRNKPDPEGYLKACQLLGVQPEQVIALEDSKNGIAAAKAAGLYCYAIHHDFIAKELLNAADEIHTKHDDILSAIQLRANW
ncbi:HAD family hydrolase [Colwellia sp. MEBiC06753]